MMHRCRDMLVLDTYCYAPLYQPYISALDGIITFFIGIKYMIYVFTKLESTFILAVSLLCPLMTGTHVCDVSYWDGKIKAMWLRPRVPKHHAARGSTDNSRLSAEQIHAAQVTAPFLLLLCGNTASSAAPSSSTLDLSVTGRWKKALVLFRNMLLGLS